jgi:hypothetical protein
MPRAAARGKKSEGEAAGKTRGAKEGGEAAGSYGMLQGCFMVLSQCTMLTIESVFSPNIVRGLGLLQKHES